MSLEDSFDSLSRAAEAQLGTIWITLKGVSMSPFLEDGDELKVRLCPVEEVSLGDICVYKAKGSFHIHRFIAKNAETFVAKGDNNPFYDQPAQYELCTGKAIQIKFQDKKILNLKKRRWKMFNLFIGSLSILEHTLAKLLWRCILFIKPRASIGQTRRFFLFQWIRLPKQALLWTLKRFLL